jgi:hypothetical protein
MEPKVHYHVHKSQPLVPILCQMNLVHTIPSYFFYIVIPRKSTYVFVVVSSGFPTKALYAFLCSTCALHTQPLSSSLT